MQGLISLGVLSENATMEYHSARGTAHTYTQRQGSCAMRTPKERLPASILRFDGTQPI